MKQFINWAIDAILPGEFDEGQGRYVFYRTSYQRHGYFVTLDQRLALLAASLPFFVVSFLFTIYSFQNYSSDVVEDFSGARSGVIFWAVNIAITIGFFMKQKILLACERSAFNRPLPRIVYLYLLGDFFLFSILIFFACAMFYLKIFMLFASAMLLLGLFNMVRILLSTVDVYKHAILDKNIV